MFLPTEAAETGRKIAADHGRAPHLNVSFIYEEVYQASFT